MSAWSDYKEKLGATSALDVVKIVTAPAGEELAATRMAICEACPRLLKATSQCKECGCFMKIKVKLAAAVCPIAKW